mmetsp:Transcript_11213/g.25889  ORF Transcript_11213/g.25889 Transcript_11213/m.25889 type:complete len:209 (+) Transcript_11213:1059-1685(+)
MLSMSTISRSRSSSYDKALPFFPFITGFATSFTNCTRLPTHSAAQVAGDGACGDGSRGGGHGSRGAAVASSGVGCSEASWAACVGSSTSTASPAPTPFGTVISKTPPQAVSIENGSPAIRPAGTSTSTGSVCGGGASSGGSAGSSTGRSTSSRSPAINPSGTVNVNSCSPTATLIASPPCNPSGTVTCMSTIARLVGEKSLSVANARL